AYEAIAFEYSRYNYNVTDFHDDSPYRSSDHDPIIVGIDLPQEQPEPTVDINLLSINDFHGRLLDYNTDEETEEITGNDTLAFAGTIEELRAEEGEENTIFLSSGDDIGASLFTSSLQQDEPTVEFLNALDLDVSTVGNHEFDWGFEHLTTEVAGWADFPHIGANVYLRESGEPALQQYETFEVDGVSVAVIGVVSQETASLVSPGGIEDIEFGDPAEAINRVVDEIGDEHDVIVASFHEGVGSVTEESTLEEKVAESAVFDSIVNDTSGEVDVIFNGHTHQLYAWEGPVPG